MREEEQLAWMYGIYTAHAVATIGKHQFPKEPIKFFHFDNDEEKKELTEEEKKLYREKLLAQLMIMQNSFNRSKKNNIE